MNGETIVRAQDVMKPDFVLIDGMATVKEALDAVREKKARCIVVKKRHDDDEYGILLFSDLAKKVIGARRAPERVNVYEVMSKPVISIRPNMDVRYVARLFETFGLNMAPVLHRSEVMGVVGYDDIVLYQPA
ncbi:MAG: CBS domain-containing protein [Gammaproteobacteria bacterium]